MFSHKLTRWAMLAVLASLMIASPLMARRAGNVAHYVQVVDENGRAVTSITTVTVRLPGTTNAATIYKDSALTLAITQPMTTASTNTTLSNGAFSWYGPDGWDYTVSDGTNTATNYGHTSMTSSDGQIVFPSYLAAISSTTYTDGQSATFGTDSDFVLNGGTVADRFTVTPSATDESPIWWFGADTTGLDVEFFAATTGDYVLWDASDERLEFVGTILQLDDDSDLQIGSDMDFVVDSDTAATLDITPLATDESPIVNLGADTSGIDLKLFAATTGDYCLWDASDEQLEFVGAAILLDDDSGLIVGSSSDVTISYDGTANSILVTEGDGAAIVDLVGFEANEAEFRLRADQGDDATDSWEIASSTTGTLTIGNDSSVAGTYVDKLTIAGSTGNVTLTGDIVNENGDTLVMSTDDTISYQSEDSDSVIQSLGFEAKEGRLNLIADQDDDATDGWELAASTTGTLTIGNDASVAGTFVDKLTIAGSTGNVTLTGDIINENGDSLLMNTDDSLVYTSDDTNATFQIMGFEASNAVLSLAADEGDDAGDTWTFTVADAGAMTIANDGTATMTINEVVGFGSGNTNAVVTVTDAATYAVTAANSGKVHIIADLSQNTNINLPAEAAGLYYKFIYCGAAAEAHDHTIDSENNANFFYGGVTHIDTDSDAGGDEAVPVRSDGNSNSQITINNMDDGTVVELYCDGTHWYITGIVVSDTAPTITDN